MELAIGDKRKTRQRLSTFFQENRISKAVRTLINNEKTLTARMFTEVVRVFIILTVKDGIYNPG